MVTTTSLTKTQYFEHLENLKNENNYKSPTFIICTNTSLEKEGNVSTIDTFLYKKQIEVKPNL